MPTLMKGAIHFSAHTPLQHFNAPQQTLCTTLGHTFLFRLFSPYLSALCQSPPHHNVLWSSKAQTPFCLLPAEQVLRLGASSCIGCSPVPRGGNGNCDRGEGHSQWSAGILLPARGVLPRCKRLCGGPRAWPAHRCAGGFPPVPAGPSGKRALGRLSATDGRSIHPTLPVACKGTVRVSTRQVPSTKQGIGSFAALHAQPARKPEF